MGRRPVKDKKMPYEYPQFAFRVTKETKNRLNSTIGEIQESMNRSRDDGEPFVNKNDVIVRALDMGLKQLRRK
ncbi:MAG: hypothetical protein KDD38_09410 [Bdellovibrionales bacterium]|nr:hypothetical protein [Bdellovibrionales bacterium]